MATLEGLSALDQVRRFWRWWTGELVACIPAALRGWVRRLSVLPMVVPEKGRAAVYRYDGKTWTPVATAQGETPEVLAKALAVQLRSARIDRFAVGLPAGQYLSKTLSIPQAAEDNLRNALLYELDRHTPFRPDEVGFDYAVVGRNDANRELIVRLVIAPKVTIANAVSTAAATGMTVASAQPALPDRETLAINLLPHEEGSTVAQLLIRWVPWLALLALGAMAIALPILQKRAQVIELQPQVNIAAQQAAAADALNQQLDRAQGEYNYLLQKRYAIPTALQLLFEVTRILPDDTWLQSFELRTTQKGRELQLQGETGVAGKMIELFEQSPLVAGTSFKSPVTQAPGSTASRFHIGMDVKDVPPPAIRSLKPDGAQVAATGPGSPPLPGSLAPGAAGTPGVSGPAPAVAPVGAATAGSPGRPPAPASAAAAGGAPASVTTTTTTTVSKSGAPGAPPAAGAAPPSPAPAGKATPGGPAGAPVPAPAPPKSAETLAPMTPEAAAMASIPNAVKGRPAAPPSSAVSASTTPSSAAAPAAPAPAPQRPGVNQVK